MDQPLLVTVGIGTPYRAALHEWACRQAYHPLDLPAAELAACPTARVALAVVAMERDADATPDRVRMIRKALSGAPLVVLASGLGVDAVVALMRSGVADVIGLPSPPADVVARAALHAVPDTPVAELVGHSPAIETLRRELAAVAPLRSTVLLTGETGVGKGLAARAVHELSRNRADPFVHVDCAALATSVIESELFGHERGAYTGAAGARAGRFELAGDGTIFLDEIGDLEAAVQVKLLRVLQDREFERLGGTTTRVMRARVVAATNRDLRAAVAAGAFRADLYFRLNVFHIEVPPLRARRSDIPMLARAGAQRIAAQLEMPLPPFSEGFYDHLCEREWPGNVRELMNEIERLLIRCHAGLDSESVDGNAGAEHALAPALAPEERERLAEALRSAGGNISRVARRMGVARSTLRYWIERNDLAHLIPRD